MTKITIKRPGYKVEYDFATAAASVRGATGAYLVDGVSNTRALDRQLRGRLDIEGEIDRHAVRLGIGGWCGVDRWEY